MESTSKMGSTFSRRSFVSGAAVAAVGAVAGARALADEPAKSADLKAASKTKEAAATDAGAEAAKGASATIGVDDSYVIRLENGLPKWGFEIAPDPIADSDISETVEDDVIVVGAGMAGICTAAACAERGGSVTLFSASSAPISRGGSNFSAYNKVIEEYGIERLDPVPFFYREERAASFTIDQQMWMRGYNNSEEAMDWVIDIVRDAGVEVFLERDNINDGGPNYAIGFGAVGQDEASASTGQQNAVVAMAGYAEAQGATLVYDTVARQLVRDEASGRVSAVIAQRSDGSYVKYVGRSAVVLATGDFSSNKEMLAKYCPQVLPVMGLEQEAEPDYNRGFALTGLYPGDGQRMGLWVGAGWQHVSTAPMMQGAWGGSNEPLGFHQGLNVNMNTERYQREDVSAPYAANHLLSQPGHVAWGIWTANYAQQLIDNGHEWYFFGNRYEVPAATADEVIAKWDAGVEAGSYVKADTLEDLAQATGLDAEKLAAVVARYNELVAAGEDADFHKDPSYLIEIDTAGPFYAAQNYAMAMTVMGGLNTNCNCQVMDADDVVIPGLFNVGMMMGNMYANNYNFAIPGNSYGINCITYGYLLGHDLAAHAFDA